jgi:Leucine zipper with capping helix domain/Mnd1 HTH domain
VDDGLVDKEKIGGSNYFWSFPAKKDRLLQIQHEKVLANIVILEKELEEANLALLDAQRGREDDSELKVPSEDATTGQPNPDTTNDTKVEDENDDEPLVKKVKRMNRAQKLHRLQELAHMKTAALSELDSLKENDPQAIADLERELQLVQQAANRWTDNIFNCQTYLTKKRGMDKKQAMKLLGITDSFDCKCIWTVYEQSV